MPSFVDDYRAEYSLLLKIQLPIVGQGRGNVLLRNRTSFVFCDYVGFRERSVNRIKMTGSMTQISKAPVTLIKARDIEINDMIMAG